VARGVTDEDLSELGGSWITPPEAALRLAEADRALTF
jgi:hypothetical protein